MHDLTHYLEQTFGYSTFREGQRAIIEDVLRGEDVLGILPTGTGKSLCYQLPAQIQEGMTVVVSPLISLMIDQVKQLKAQGYKSVVALNSFMDREQRLNAMNNLTRYQLIYVSPEMLQNDWVIERLQQSRVDLFVIDEAHCISQWGHEFRTDYLKLHRVIHQLGDPTVLALSATATPEVQEDIKEKLNRPAMKQLIYPMDKPNISFAVRHLSSPNEKVEQIKQVIAKNDAPTMIYFSSRQWAERVATDLQLLGTRRVAFYHGGMEQTDRMLVQQQFMNDQLDVICCTSAFGMGVDKKNIRLVIHFHFPAQLESFIQEVGRAGRDGLPCVSLVLHTTKDHYLPQMLIESELPEKADVNWILSQISGYRSSNELLPEDELALEVLHLSESQWNFIKYQLEERGIIEGRQVINKPDDPHVVREIIQVVQERWHYKQSKLKEMIDWIHHTECRREALYRPFQEEVRTPVVACCDACSFEIDALELTTEGKKRITQTWEDRLAQVFGRGGKYETSS